MVRFRVKLRQMSFRTFWIGAALLVLVVAVAFAWRTAGQAAVAAAAMAKVSCSCVFVGERSLDSCRGDDPPGFEQISVSIDRQAQTSTASAFGLLTRRARYTAAYGCTLEP